MLKQSKRSILHEQLPDIQQLRHQNEIQLSKALYLFQSYIQLQTQNQLEEVVESLSHIEFLRKNCPEGGKVNEFVLFAAKFFKYEYFKKGNIIFNYEDFGDKMYIILKGEVGVLLPRSREDIQNDQEWLAQQNLLEDYESIWNKRKSKQLIELDLMQKKLGGIYFIDGIPHFQKVFQYYSGQAFGDVALTSDKPRSASILVISEECHLITINKQDYKTVCDKSIQEMNAKIDYFLKLFPGNGKFSVSRFLQNFHQITFAPSTILWKEGDEPKFFFLILKGRVELYRNIFEEVLKGKQAPVLEGQFKSKFIQKKKVILSQLSDNSFVGQEELIDGLNIRQFSCQVSDETQAYYMESEDFNVIKKSFPDIVKCLKEKAQQITQYMQNRQKTIINNFSQQNSQNVQKLNQKQQSQKVERRTVLEIFKDQEDRPDQNLLRSYAPKVLTQTEITDQNVKINEKKTLNSPQGEFVMLDAAIIEQIRDRLQRMQIITSEPDKKERIKTMKFDDSQILVNRIQSAVKKGSFRMNKQYTEIQLNVKSDQFESTIPMSTKSSKYRGQTLSKKSFRFRKTQSSRHTVAGLGIATDLDFLTQSPMKRIHTAFPSSVNLKSRLLSSQSRHLF